MQSHRALEGGSPSCGGRRPNSRARTAAGGPYGLTWFLQGTRATQTNRHERSNANTIDSVFADLEGDPRGSPPTRRYRCSFPRALASPCCYRSPRGSLLRNRVLGLRPSSRATTARRSLRGERRPLSSAVGTPQALRHACPADERQGRGLFRSQRNPLGKQIAGPAGGTRSPKAPRLARHSASVFYAGLGPGSESRASGVSLLLS